jgi:choline-sulfatase
VPFNRLYDPERMPAPVLGDLAVDHADEQIPWMNHLIWADEVDPLRARCCRARYYGELTYIDWCLGRILDAVDARPDAADTLVCFFSDHGDLLGDHHGWQKECFFEASVRVPFLVSWPARIAPGGARRDDLVGLEDLFAIATGASRKVEPHGGFDVLGLIAGTAAPRERYVSYHELPGTRHFKVMVRRGPWKYIFLANGGRALLFDVARDPDELENRVDREADVAAEMRRLAVEACRHPGAADALEGDRLRAFEFRARPRTRIVQMDATAGARGFPDHPREAIEAWEAVRAGRRGAASNAGATPPS